ncbi:MAG TPA: serine/threonine protein kinase [Polyangiaceae bacterium]|nr:serine/threonine protein kinase [Polyangiaceae bacterium]
MDSNSPTAVVPAAIVAGKYRLTRLLGRGGMGSVWEGIHATLGTRVAVKFIDAEHAESPEARRRFENEARAAATLRSKHVVEVYDHGLMDDGRPFIVMEFLEGEPLDRRVERAGRLPARDTAHLVSMICRALSKAHAAGIVHRDLKPDNVFLVWDDEDASDVAKVVDFGIAKFTDSKGPISATRTGSVLGTPYYMSPEQARGLRTVDHRSDLWSVGVIAYRCITGHLPFEGEAVGDVLVKLCTAALPVPSEVVPNVPPGFDAWFARALAREPEGRFQSASELATSLALVCGLSVRASLPFDSTGGSSPNLNVRISSGVTPFVPATPFTATTPSASLGRPPQITGAPLTQTPAPTRPRSNRSGLVAGGVAAVISLAIAAGVITKLLHKGDAAAHAVSATSDARPEAVSQILARPAPVEVAKPEVVPAPGPPPTPSASAASVESKPVAAQAVLPKRPVQRAAKPAPKGASKSAAAKPADDIGF